MSWEAAQRRLMLAHVTTWCVVALVALLFDWAQWLGRITPFSPTTPLLNDLTGLFIVVVLQALINLPFDIVGGWVLWRRFEKQPVTKWTRYVVSASLHGVALWVCGSLLLTMGLANCLSGVLALAAGLMLAQVQWQAQIASWLGRMPFTKRNLSAEDRLLRRHNLAIDNIRILESRDSAFTGGYSGRPGHAVLVVPAHWFDEVGAAYTSQQLIRRAGALKHDSRRRGLLIAAVFNLSGLMLASWLPHAGFASIGELTTTMLAFTLWSAVGHLTLLPQFSRRGVLECDYFASKKAVPKRKIAQTLRQTEALLQVDNTRPEQADRWLHPIPLSEARLDVLASHIRPTGAWNTQQMALYLSWPCVGLLSRTVWNTGRPELWVYGIGE